MKRASQRMVVGLLVGVVSGCAAAPAPRKDPAPRKMARPVAPTPPPFDPDSSSGADKVSTGAIAIELNKQVDGNVDYSKGDRTDWKSVDVGGEGTLVVELRWDQPAADLSIHVFDVGNQELGSPPGTPPVAVEKPVSLKETGTYLLRIVPVSAGPLTLRIQALNEKDAADYTILVRLIERKRPTPVRVVDETIRAPSGSPEDGLQGRIVSRRKEGDWFILHLDKGAAAGVRKGQRGWILARDSGIEHVGFFEVTEVIDDARSIARTRSSAPRNRMSIDTGR